MSDHEANEQIHACSARESFDFLSLLRGMAEHAGNLAPVSLVGAMRNLRQVREPLAAIHLIGKTWEPGRTIKVGFLDGSPVQQKKVQRWAEEWGQYGNLHLAFGASNPEIRISFNPRSGSWSYIGTDNLGVRSGPTMNYGWVTADSTVAADRAVILHEFGHAFGLGHEQGHPDEDIAWDVPAALSYYMSTQGWSEQMVRDNVFAVFDRNEVAGTLYDRTSIMQYPVPPQLTTDGRGIGWNTDLSTLDRAHFGAMYPGSVVPPVPPVIPPTVPPVPVPDGLPTIAIGGPASRLPILVPGQPARFRLVVPASQVLDLGVVVENSRGRDPVVVAILQGGPGGLSLTLPRGKGLFHFEAGVYEIQIFNPIARLTGVAWIKVSPR